ncbi:MAG: GNAT family N-acetyltransferase, partial [Pseudomonadota bacterium]
MTDETPFPRPLSSDPLERPPSAVAPPREVFEGRTVRLEPLDPARHGDELFAAVEDDDPARWWWLPYGPFNGARAGFDAHLDSLAASTDPLFFAIRCKSTGRAEGVASYLEISPPDAAIEIGH